jgi:hypothetical protein
MDTLHGIARADVLSFEWYRFCYFACDQHDPSTPSRSFSPALVKRFCDNEPICKMAITTARLVFEGDSLEDATLGAARKLGKSPIARAVCRHMGLGLGVKDALVSVAHRVVERLAARRAVRGDRQPHDAGFPDFAREAMSVLVGVQDTFVSMVDHIVERLAVKRVVLFAGVGRAGGSATAAWEELVDRFDDATFACGFIERHLDCAMLRFRDVDRGSPWDVLECVPSFFEHTLLRYYADKMFTEAQVSGIEQRLREASSALSECDILCTYFIENDADACVESLGVSGPKESFVRDMCALSSEYVRSKVERLDVVYDAPNLTAEAVGGCLTGGLHDFATWCPLFRVHGGA